MHQIKLETHEQEQIAHGNQKVLKGVLERENEKLNTLLRGHADFASFRFYQGMAQAIESVIKILPS